MKATTHNIPGLVTTGEVVPAFVNDQYAEGTIIGYVPDTRSAVVNGELRTWKTIHFDNGQSFELPTLWRSPVGPLSPGMEVSLKSWYEEGAGRRYDARLGLGGFDDDMDYEDDEVIEL